MVDKRLVIRTLPDQPAKLLGRKLKDRVPLLVCRTCEQRDFALIEAPLAGIRTTLSRGGQSEDGKAFFIQQPLVTLICTNCGHIEQFAEAVINGTNPSMYGGDHASE